MEPVYTGNIAFNILANAQTSICLNINVTMRIRVINGCLDRLSNDEIIALFDPLFDNALNIAAKSEDKHIELPFKNRMHICLYFLHIQLMDEC